MKSQMCNPLEIINLLKINRNENKEAMNADESKNYMVELAGGGEEKGKNEMM